MERLMFSFHKTINAAYSIAAYFTLVLHLMQAPVWVLYALLRIINFSCIS